MRKEFIALFSFKYSDGGSPFNIVSLRFGGDDGDLEAVDHTSYYDEEMDNA
jgi:hypothetical protein